MNDPNWAQIATVVIALLAFLGAIAQLRRASRADKRAAAYRYFERWTSGDAVKYQAKTAEHLVDVPPWKASQALAEFRSKPYEERLETMLFMNYYEELGGLYNQGLVDRKVIRKYLGAAVIDTWERTAWFIGRARATSPRTFDQWKKMYEDVKAHREGRTLRQRMARLVPRTRAKLRGELERERELHSLAAARERELAAALSETRGWRAPLLRTRRYELRLELLRKNAR